MARVRRWVWLVSLIPLAWLAWGAWQGGLGANPVERVIRFCGDWALWGLLLTLTVTPLRRIPGWSGLIRYRRMLGLSAFFYAVLHVTGYVVLDHFFAWQTILKDILKRPYITIGLTAFLLLVPLAITSTRGWIRRLGSAWQKLHRLIYPASVLVVIHYFMMVKADYRAPLVHAGILGVLLGWRVGWWLWHRQPVG
ncbi:MAG: sulfoxide reductase heme-binding subunit YedZ [Magnetococcales bacterium]|nr:sulfoxide reductase heme-binding subunit YedZ [Magnetococcales bacterium]